MEGRRIMSFFKWSRANQKTKVIRYGKPSFDAGVYVNNPIDEFSIWTSTQPLSNADRDLIQNELNLNRYTEGVRIYANEPLIADDEKRQVKGDRVIVEGEAYKVFTISSWQHLNIRHYRHIALREN